MECPKCKLELKWDDNVCEICERAWCDDCFDLVCGLAKSEFSGDYFPYNICYDCYDNGKYGDMEYIYMDCYMELKEEIKKLKEEILHLKNFPGGQEYEKANRNCKIEKNV